MKEDAARVRSGQEKARLENQPGLKVLGEDA